jgi:ABC-type uncharacterized transport system ATPase subunit
MENVKIAQNISYLINNVSLNIVSMLNTNVIEMGVEEYSEELEKLAQVKSLLEEVEKGVRRKSLGLKKKE